MFFVMNMALITTKTFIPTAPLTLVQRPRLLEKLEAALARRHKLVLISAPAGSGKSTLLVEWAAQAQLPLAWVTLDALDNDPQRFWTYVLLAIRNLKPDFLTELYDLLRSQQPPAMDEIVPELSNRLGEIDERIVLALDDYHAVDNPEIHAQVERLVEHAPEGFTLALATRSDPPLPVHRWRARGQLTEIRSADLRFNSQEAATFFNERMELALPPELVTSLEGRTEGWAVGLQLAGLSLQGKAGPQAQQEFVIRFSASHFYVLEYLTREVLEQQPEDVRQFLLGTCVLDELCSALCDHVLEMTGSAEMLNRLLQSNLFMMPLDDERTWFRYHHLFAELLRMQLSGEQPEQAAVLHRRAAAWYAENGWVDASLGHALAAGDHDFACDLVNRSWREALHTGRLRDSVRWIRALPEDIRSSRPLLSAAYAWNLFLLGQNDAAEVQVDITSRRWAEMASVGSIPDDEPEFTTLPGQIAALRGMIASRRLDFRAAAEQAQAAIRLTPPGETLSLGPAWLGLSNAQRELGQFEEAIRSYRETMPLMRASQNLMGWAVAVYFQGKALQIQGRLHEALEVYQSAEQIVNNEDQQNPAAYALIQVGLGELWYEWNDLEKAAAALALAHERDRMSGYVDMLRFGGLLAGRLERARGDLAAGIQALRDALRKLQHASALNAQAEVRAWLVRYRVEAGELDELDSWQETFRPDLEWGFTQGVQSLCLAQSCLSAGRAEQAYQVSDRLAGLAERSGSAGWMIEAGLARSLALWELDQQDEAFESLAACLEQAQSEGYLRIFGDAGAPAGALLRAYRKRLAPDDPRQAYLVRLEAIAPKPPARTASTAGARTILTRRELAVLRLMAEGISNPEIARRLYISPGTVKTHVSHIYDKLDVLTRTEAVVKAIEMKLIEGL